MIGARRLAGLLLALALAGCGGSRSDEGTLVVASQKGGARAMMIAAGVLEGAPYKIEWSDFPSVSATVEAVNSGAVDTAGAGEQPFLVAAGAGSTARVIDIMQATGNGALTALIVPKGSPVRSLADLKGRKIATTNGSVGHFLLLALLREAKIDPKAIQLVLLTPGDAKAAFESGSVDAWATWDPFLALATVEGGARVVADGKGRTRGYGFQIASAHALKTKQAQLKDFLVRWHKAQAWAVAHRAQYAEVWARETGLPLAVAEQSLAHIQTVPVPFDETVPANVRRNADQLLAFGLLAKPFDTDRIFDRAFLDGASAGSP